MLAPGDYGIFEGAEDDAVVFGRYVRDGRWSAGLVELLAGVLAGGGTLIDVGAHVGLVSIPALQHNGACGFAFEPEPTNFAFLRRNIARHGMSDRLEALPFALDAQAGRVRLALSDDNAGDHRLLRDDAAPGGRKTLVIDARGLDEWFGDRELAAPVVLKLDAQGSEARVLRGGARTLARVDHVLTEFWPAGLARLGDSVETLKSSLADFGWGCVLGEAAPSLIPTADVFGSLAWILGDGSDEGFFDLWLSRSRQKPR